MKEIKIYEDYGAVGLAMYSSVAYDSSADYWKLNADGSLEYDAEGWLKNADGKYVNKDGTVSDTPTPGKTIGAEGIETGLLNILNGGTSGKSYDSYSAAEKNAVQQLMINSGMTHTVDVNNISNTAAWMWRGEGTHIVTIGLQQFEQSIDADASNMGIKLNNNSLLSSFKNSFSKLIYNTLSSENAYNFLSKNNLNTYGLVNLPANSYTTAQIAAANAYKDAANANAELEDVQPGYPNYYGQTEYAGGSPLTWCNRKVYHDNDYSFGLGNYNYMLEEEGTEFTNANNLGDNLSEKYTELDAITAQSFANAGYKVIASWIHPDFNDASIAPANKRSGHVASVVANYGVYDPRLGPRISQAGPTNGEMWTSQGFGVNKLPDVKYYWALSDDEIDYRDYKEYWY